MTHSPHIRRASLRRSRRGLLALAAAVALAACASADRASGPYTSGAPATRDPAKAQALTAEASGLIVTDPQRAEQLLRDALSADLYHGPAHNNLGVIHLGRGDLYEAASEFE